MSDVNGYRLPEPAWEEVRRFVRDQVTGQITFHFVDGEVKTYESNVKYKIPSTTIQVQQHVHLSSV